MAIDNSFDTYHVAPISYDHEGHPIADAPFTDTSDTKRHVVFVPPEKVIPVILVPGTMGSNLKLKTLPEGFAKKRYTEKVKAAWRIPPVKRTTTGWGDKAWAPDDAVTFMLQRYYPLVAHERRRLLDPANTEVDDRAEVDPKYALKGFTFESTADGKQKKERAEQRQRGFLLEMKRRGWSGVFQSCYVPLLAFLEYNLNRMFYFDALNDFWDTTMISGSQAADKRWSVIKGAKALAEEDVKKAARYWYPVHAVGYNWIQSNKDSAQYLLRKIKKITDRFKAMGYECDKVILVTHSMGGLVARAAAHPKLGENVEGAADMILGVIHGVMPTHGAATAYRRCHAGFEGAAFGTDMNVAARILGKDGPEVSAIFSGSPGALELLPNKLYGTGWLKIKDQHGELVKALPEADPYKEIYEQKDVWWRLMNPAWVDPAPGLGPEERDDTWDRYLITLDKASAFHQKLSASHHPHTFVQYSADPKFPASGTVTWSTPRRAKPMQRRPLIPGLRREDSGHNIEGVQDIPTVDVGILASKDFEEDGFGDVTLKDVQRKTPTGLFTKPLPMSLAQPSDPGDGTVPELSAKGINDTVEMVAAHNPGYDHQGAYETKVLQELTTYGIVRLVAQYMP
jgi:pimeloyl-ACP methyl ester carboxylesterase